MQRFSAITSRAAGDINLTDSEYRTLGTIAAHADKDGWCYPSQKTIADIRGVTRQTINTHVKRLTDLGYLNIQARYRGDGGQTSNMMQVKLDFHTEDLTGGVKPGFDRGCKAKDLTGGVKPGFDTNTSEETLQNNIYELPEEFTPFPEMSEQKMEMVSTLSGVVKDTAAVGITEKKFDNAADDLINRGISTERVKAFSVWWEANGYYNGKPALTSLLQEIDNSIQGITNGKSNGPDYRPLWNQVKAEITKNGRRSQKQWNGQIAPVLKKAGGYTRLCSLSTYDAEQTFKSAFQDTQ